MTALPFVSVIVPAFNEERNIGAALEALCSQTYARDRYELIVVDNGSTDRTAEVVGQFDVRYVYENRLRGDAVRNAGIACARGDLVAFTDADDMADARWLQHMAQGWEDPSVGGRKGLNIYFWDTPPDRPEAAGLQALAREESLLLKTLPFCVGTNNVVYRREVLLALGGFDPRLLAGGDLFLAWRVINELGLRIPLNAHALVFVRNRNRTTAGLRHALRTGWTVARLRRLMDRDGNALAIQNLAARLRSLTLTSAKALNPNFGPRRALCDAFESCAYAAGLGLEMLVKNGVSREFMWPRNVFDSHSPSGSGR